VKRQTIARAGAVLGAAAMALGLAVGPASADPDPVTDYRQLAGAGSDTTQDVLNGLGVAVGGGDVIASWDARGTATISTKSAAQNPNCQGLVRPNGSGQGRSALQASENGTPWQGKTITGCIDFARSSSAPGSPNPAGTYTYIPFGVDAMSYAVHSNAVTDLGFPSNLTRRQLEGIYKCVITRVNGIDVNPLLPQSGSGSRAFWLSQVDILEDELSSYPCIDQRNNTIQEHDGRVLQWSLTNNTADIVPFSVGQYIAQGNAGETHGGVLIDVENRRGSAVLGRVNGVVPTTGPVTDPVLNTTFPIVRDVYNVVPTHDIEGASPDAAIVNTFVGANSAVCQARAVVEAFGFGFRTTSVPGDQLKLACGATTLRANS
jgi:ABC-type phosphate transport system substrate-binding protein